MLTSKQIQMKAEESEVLKDAIGKELSQITGNNKDKS